MLTHMGKIDRGHQSDGCNAITDMSAEFGGQTPPAQNAIDGLMTKQKTCPA